MQRRSFAPLVLGLVVAGGCAPKDTCLGGGSDPRPVAASHAPGPTLTMPFRLRGHEGRVAVRYDVNRDPSQWGFDRIGLPADFVARTVGFPVFDAAVDYEGRGYLGLMGWIQLVTVHDTQSGHDDTSVDQLPILRESDTPFAALANAPESFDAPGPNPPRTDETWTAFTFLAACPDIGRTRRVAPVLGVKWGYRLVAGRATPFAVEPIALTEWDRLAPFLRERYPRWQFLSSATVL